MTPTPPGPERPLGAGAHAPTVGRFTAGLVGLFVLTTVGWMGLWAVATTFLYGSAPVVVSSGSMAPALDVGDLVVVEPYHGQRIHTGSVVVFDDQAAGRSTIHRVVEVAEDGTFTTRGDANPVADSAPLDIADVDASGRFLLPRMGLPIVWAQQGRWPLVVLTLAGLVLAVWLARFALADAHDPWLAGVVPDPGTGLILRERLARTLARARTSFRQAGVAGALAGMARRRTAEVGALALAFVLAHATVSAYAAFADTTANTGNQFGAGTLAAPSGFGAAPGSCVGAATIAFRSASSGRNTLGDELVLARPSGVQAGDVLIAGITWHTHDYSGTLIDPPSGWHLIRIDTEFSHVVQGLFWRAAGASEPATYTFSNGTADLTREVVGGIAAYSGVDTTDPIDAHDGLTETSVVFSIDAPSVTSTVTGGRLISVFGQHDPGLFAPPTGMTDRYATAVGTGERSVNTIFADQVLGAAGATGVRTATGSGNGSGVGQSVVLDPGGGVMSAALSWTATSSSYADGYLLQRFIGTTLDDQWTITPRSSSSIVDFGGLAAGTTYTYRLRTTSGTWRSTAVTVTYTAAPC